MRFRDLLWGVIIAISLAGISCAPTAPDANRQMQSVRRLILQIRQNPKDDKPYSDLGVLLFEMGNLNYASKSLMRAYKLNPQNAQTLYFLGQVLEKRNDNAKALQIYYKYLSVDSPAEYCDLMEGQYRILKKKQLRAEYQRMLQDESTLEIKQTLPNGVAVLPFQYIGTNPDEYGPIGKGLAEMMMTDLSQIRKLKLVERIRVQTLMDEINLSQTGLLDESTSPKFGKMLGAAKMVQGNFSVDPGKRIQMDVSYSDIMNLNQPDPVVVGDKMDNLFKLEKDLVFQVVGQMGIRLTPAERENIQRIPTQSVQAFMAYCMGLEMQDRGNFDQAASYFQQALQLDPGYSQARTNVRTSRRIAQVERAPQNLTRLPDSRQAYQPDVPVQAEMIQNRLQIVNQNIGNTYLPGADSRKSSEEFISSATEDREDTDIRNIFESFEYQDLPEPPPVPTP